MSWCFHPCCPSHIIPIVGAYLALKLKIKLHLKHRRPVWSGYGTHSLPPRKGRKPKNDKFLINEKILGIMEKLSGRGLNKQQIAHNLDISIDTLQNRCKDDPVVEAAVSAAIKKGRDKGIGLVVNTLFTQALNPRAVADRIFWLKNMAGFKDAYSSEVTGKDGGPIETTVKREYNDQERAARLASILAGVEKRAGASKLKLKGRKK